LRVRPPAARAAAPAAGMRDLQRAGRRYRKRQLHDLLREHARTLAAADNDPPEADRAVGRLLDYYLHTAVRTAVTTQIDAALNRADGALPPAAGVSAG
jgi:hypothetical protein